MKLQYLDLATCHLTEETMQGLDNGSCCGITIANYEYGVFVSVPGEVSVIDALDCPADLRVALRYARAEGCDVIRFDSDAEIDPALQHFDW
jgi:hypothetical protein